MDRIKVLLKLTYLIFLLLHSYYLGIQQMYYSNCSHMVIMVGLSFLGEDEDEDHAHEEAGPWPESGLIYIYIYIYIVCRH